VKLTEELMADLDRESPITARALGAVPAGRDDWKPHPKSMPLGRLAALVAMMPSWLTMMVAQDEFDVAPPPGTPSQFSIQAASANELAETVASHAPITLWVTKEAVRRIQEARTVPNGDDLVAKTYGSADFHEGVRAFVEKRPPLWSGR